MERAKQTRHAGDAAEKLADRNIRRTILRDSAISENNRNQTVQPEVIFSASPAEIPSIPHANTPQMFD